MEDILLNKILAEYPDFNAVSSYLLPSRHSYILEVKTASEKLIFKFPNNKKYNFLKEIQVLNYLKDRLNIVTPAIVYTGNKNKFFGYKKIDGTVPSWEEFIFLSKQEQKKILTQLANFLARLHKCIDLETAKKLSVNNNPTEQYVNNIKENLDILDDVVKDFAKKLIAKKYVYEGFTQAKQFVYNDLHPNNIVLDENNNVTAILDFGFCAIGDVHREFHQIHKVCPDLLEFFIGKYQQITGVEISLEKVIWLSQVDLLSYYISLKNAKPIDKMAVKNTLQGVYNLIHG